MYKLRNYQATNLSKSFDRAKKYAKKTDISERKLLSAYLPYVYGSTWGKQHQHENVLKK